VNDEVDLIPVLEDLSDRELELIQCASRGDVLVCSKCFRFSFVFVESREARTVAGFRDGAFRPT
jgi:hypothetical protein